MCVHMAGHIGRQTTSASSSWFALYQLAWARIIAEVCADRCLSLLLTTGEVAVLSRVGTVENVFRTPYLHICVHANYSLTT